MDITNLDQLKEVIHLGTGTEMTSEDVSGHATDVALEGGENLIDQLPVKAVSKQSEKQAPKNPLGHFLLEEKTKLSNSSEKLNYPVVMSKWKSLSSLQKEKYKKMYKDEKDKLGKSYRSNIHKNKMNPELVHEKKLKRDRKWQTHLREKKAQEKAQEKENIEKLKKMVERKTEKKFQMEALGENLRSELLSYQIETQAVLKLIKEKERSHVVMKEKYKLAFKHRTSCLQK